MELEIFIKLLKRKEKIELFKLLLKEIPKEVKRGIIKKPEKEIGTSVHDFCRKVKMSGRLRNILMDNRDYLGYYIEDIDSKAILRCRNAGVGSVKEFISVRGF